MIRGSIARLVLIFVLGVVLAACTARPLAEWRDSEFTGVVDNILVIGVSDQAVVRRLFEDTFVSELALLGVSARSSYRILSDEQISSKEALDAVIRAQSMDAVLVTSVVGIEQIETYTPPTYTYVPPPRTYKPSSFDRHYQDYHSYFNHAVRVATPGYWDKYEVLILESNLYDSASQQLIWTVQSESFDPRSAKQMIDDQIAIALKSLRKTGLLSN